MKCRVFPFQGGIFLKTNDPQLLLLGSIEANVEVELGEPIKLRKDSASAELRAAMYAYYMNEADQNLFPTFQEFYLTEMKLMKDQYQF